MSYVLIFYGNVSFKIQTMLRECKKYKNHLQSEHKMRYSVCYVFIRRHVRLGNVSDSVTTGKGSPSDCTILCFSLLQAHKRLYAQSSVFEAPYRVYMRYHFIARCPSFALRIQHNKQAPCTSSVASSVLNTDPPLRKQGYNKHIGYSD